MSTQSLNDKTILLVITGGIAAYKSLELIRLLRKAGAQVRCVLTKGGAEFVTPLSVSALSEHQVYTDLWSLKDESEMGHIRLSREADLIMVAPATADILAKMAHGLADDLASTLLLAADKPVFVAPAMNPQMWTNPATQANISTLNERNIRIISPAEGEAACGEEGVGRMVEPETLFADISDFFLSKPLKGKKALVTSGPTFEPLDPVRFLGNRSSGKQGHAIAQSLAQAGAEVTLISGPVNLPDPIGVQTIHVQTAQDMLEASLGALPADMAVCAAAVSDWRATKPALNKLKKREDVGPPVLDLRENPDILKTLAQHEKRPALLIGFAAESENLVKNAQEKLKRKGCDWLLANEIYNGEQSVFGAAENRIHLITTHNTETWPLCPKTEVAQRLTNKMIEYLKDK